MFRRQKRREQLLKDWRTRRMRETGVLESENRPLTPRPRQRRHASNPAVGAPMQRLRSNPSRLAGLIGAAALTALSANLWLADSYRIESATLSGNTRVPAHAVFAAAGLHGQRVFTVDAQAAAERIESLPDVDRADIDVAFPSTVHIEVQETAPVLLWHCGSGTWAVDDLGRVVSLPADSRGLPIVSDASGTVSGPGDRIGAELLQAGKSYSARYGQLIYGAEFGYVATSPEGWEVRLGTDARRDHRQAAILDSLRARLADESGSVALVDLRFDGRPYYRLKGQGD